MFKNRKQLVARICPRLIGVHTGAVASPCRASVPLVALLVFCFTAVGCGRNATDGGAGADEPTAQRRGEESERFDGAPASDGQQRVASRYVKVRACQYRTDSQGILSELPRTFDERADIARIASWFKQLDQGEESPTAASWEPDARVEFFRKDGTLLTVYLDSELEYWTEGAGDWPLPKAFAPYFRSLFAAPQRRHPFDNLNARIESAADANRKGIGMVSKSNPCSRI